MDLNGGRRPNVFISNPKNPTMSDFTKCLNSCVNYWYDKWNALYMDPSGGVSSPNSNAFSPNLKADNTFPISFIKGQGTSGRAGYFFSGYGYFTHPDVTGMV